MPSVYLLNCFLLLNSNNILRKLFLEQISNHTLIILLLPNLIAHFGLNLKCCASSVNFSLALLLKGCELVTYSQLPPPSERNRQQLLIFQCTCRKMFFYKKFFFEDSYFLISNYFFVFCKSKKKLYVFKNLKF